MSASATSNTSDVWQLDANQAVLCTPQLTAQVDLRDPRAGLNHLIFMDSSIRGSVLGVSPGSHAAPAQDDLSDVFVRGSDLVATYAETSERPFSLQIYWRANAGDHGVVLLDAILSLQTDLLESFPGVAVESNLFAGEHCALPVDGSDSQLIRASSGDWSYAETTHPDDRGDSQIMRSGDETFTLQRQLGGRFLEKGVIRRLRVRGVFLPRENDEEVAIKCLQSLATEEPPLTV